MKKIMLSLLAISTIASAESVVLKCSFPGKKDSTIKIHSPENVAYSYDIPGCIMHNGLHAFIGDESIFINGNNCSINIRRDTGAVKINDFKSSGTVVYEGTCAKQSNAI